MIADRFANIELSLIRQINALATSESINLGIGEPNLEPDETFREFAKRAATTSWHYSPNAGNVSLRKKLGDPNEICVTAGTEEALYAIFQAFVNPGDEVLIPNPGFVVYATLAKICGATPVPYDLEPFVWTVGKLPVTSKTKLIVVNSPSNPLGAVIDEAKLREIAELGPLVVSDEVYREIWYESPPASMRGMSPNVIAVGGMSKSHGMTGLRLGWIHARPELMKTIVMAHQYIATCASVFSQALAEEILDHDEWNAQWLAHVRAQFRDQREAALYALRQELGVEFGRAIDPPAGAFYAFVPVPFCKTIEFAKTVATDAGVLVIPGIAFGSAGEGFIRVSYAATTQQIAAGIERIGRWLRTSIAG
ncbi:MAG TPA: pyridoxal phosphate-dependent aminotransferase [Thermoanaerobaculia bacterium]|nr:pyridoxal phosphate-dependent aminotransferase [Thermoanaerobaculia bacterium]